MIRRPPRSTPFPTRRSSDLIVPDDQLALAIGREGQNARLAARLTGWRIDIRSETEFAQEEHDEGYEEERSEEHTSELQSRQYLVCRLLLEKKNIKRKHSLA